MNIPWFVSRGYLVFTPDVHYVLGKTGKSAYNSVVSAASYLCQFPWVDATRLGINGHSFGGFETNYIATHTNIFAAVSTAAGPSNLISFYGGFYELRNVESSSHMFCESSQMRMGASLWQRPDLYIENSPIFYVDKISSPVLIMHNKYDGAVSWMQSVEFFNALRRVGQTAWMLQYDDGEHGVSGRDAIDYTKRLTQFFDHYLKSNPPPAWMTQGRPANLKGVDDRFELDLEGSCGDSCKTCKRKEL